MSDSLELSRGWVDLLQKGQSDKFNQDAGDALIKKDSLFYNGNSKIRADQ